MIGRLGLPILSLTKDRMGVSGVPSHARQLLHSIPAPSHVSGRQSHHYTRPLFMQSQGAEEWLHAGGGGGGQRGGVREAAEEGGQNEVHLAAPGLIKEHAAQK
jgi:hypothetical protein